MAYGSINLDKLQEQSKQRHANKNREFIVIPKPVAIKKPKIKKKKPRKIKPLKIVEVKTEKQKLQDKKFEIFVIKTMWAAKQKKIKEIAEKIDKILSSHK